MKKSDDRNFSNSYTNSKSEILNLKQTQISKFKCSKLRFEFCSFGFRNCSPREIEVI